VAEVTTPWDRAFYARPAECVARDLIGAVLIHHGRPGRRARIVETEAYVGAHDLACHASKGRTKRTEVMFGPPGHAYVYFIYGMHWMLNVVTMPEGEPQAVLIRAAESLTDSALSLSGPGRLARGMGITGELNGTDLLGGPLTVEWGEPPPVLAVSPRIGIGFSGAWADAPLRFYDPGSPAVSRPPRRFRAGAERRIEWGTGAK
jgi:DNA-3-methyladenine glycosylase